MFRLEGETVLDPFGESDASLSPSFSSIKRGIA